MERNPLRVAGRILLRLIAFGLLIDGGIFLAYAARGVRTVQDFRVLTGTSAPLFVPGWVRMDLLGAVTILAVVAVAAIELQRRRSRG